MRWHDAAHHSTATRRGASSPSTSCVTCIVLCSVMGLIGINIPLIIPTTSSLLLSSRRQSPQQGEGGNPTYGKDLTAAVVPINGNGELRQSSQQQRKCNISLLDRPEAVEVFWNNEALVGPLFADYNVTLHTEAITNNVTPRYFGHKAACLPYPRGNKPGVWSMPRRVWISQPCFVKSGAATTVGRQQGLTMCACDTRVVPFENVYWATDDVHNRYDIMSVAITKMTNPLTNDTEWFAIDRSNLNLGRARCVGDFRTDAARFQRLIENIATFCEHRGDDGGHHENDVLVEVYFALGTILVPQAHRLESLLTAAANYYASGLHLRRVPWALPKLLSKASQGIVESYLELTTLLDIPVVYYNESAVQFAKRVHFFEDEHGENFMCFKPFLKNYLWPRVLEIAKEKKFAVYENVSFLKQKGSRETGVFTPSRGFAVSPRFLNFANHTLHMPIFNVLPLAEKMFYVNTASNILTCWGGPASFVFLLMMPRPVRVILLVHKRYAREAMGTRINFKQKRGLSRVFEGAIARSKGLMYDFEHEDFKARFVHTRNLETLIFDNLFEAIMTPSFALGPSPW